MTIKQHTRGHLEERGAAFSLIEIMVAVGLLAVIIVALLAMFYQTQRAFRAGLTQVDILEAGRATMELITHELQEASASTATVTTNLQTAVVAGPVALKPPDDGVTTMIQDIAFLRKINDDWVGESYRVSNAVAGVGTLYRLLVTSNRNSVAGADVAGLSEYIRRVPFGFGTTNTNFMRVAEGVLHFRVLPFDYRGVPITNNSPDGVIADPNGRGLIFFSNALPAYVDVELALLEPKSLEQFRMRPDPAKATDYLSRQAGRMHFFKQRVQLRNGPQFPSVTNVP